MIAGWGQKHADNFRLKTRQLYTLKYEALCLNSSEKIAGNDIYVRAH